MKLLSNDELINAIENTSISFNISKDNIEKDFYICRILSELEKDEEIEYAILEVAV